MPAKENFKEDFVLLLEAGFVAVSYLEEDAARKLFEASQLLRPESTLPQIGLASIDLHKLDTKSCIKTLEKVRVKEPDNDRAGALLGISYLIAGQRIEEGEKLLDHAMNHSDDPAVQKLGKLWLEVLEKGVRKSDLPLQPKKPKEKKTK